MLVRQLLLYNILLLSNTLKKCFMEINIPNKTFLYFISKEHCYLQTCGCFGWCFITFNPVYFPIHHIIKLVCSGNANINDSTELKQWKESHNKQIQNSICEYVILHITLFAWISFHHTKSKRSTLTVDHQSDYTLHHLVCHLHTRCWQ